VSASLRAAALLGCCLELGCGASALPSPQLVVKGLSAAPYYERCVDSTVSPQRLWLRRLDVDHYIPLQAGQLRPTQQRKRPLPQLVEPQGADLSSERPLPCQAEALPERGVLTWQLEGSQLKLSPWGWASEAERRLLPRALSVAGLDPRRRVLYLGGADGLWWWPLKSRSAPRALPLPIGLRAPITRLVRDGSGWWVRGADGRAVALKLSSALAPDGLSRRAEPLSELIDFPERPAQLSLPLGGRLLRAAQGGLELTWGEQRLISPPVLALASLDARHVAVGTSEGLTVYQASSERGAEQPLHAIAQLRLGAAVTELILHEATLYLICPKRGIIWAELSAPRSQRSQPSQTVGDQPIRSAPKDI